MRKAIIAGLLAGVTWYGPAFATNSDCNGSSNCNTDNSTTNQGGTGIGVGIGRGGDASSFSGSSSSSKAGAAAGAAAVGLNRNANTSGATSSSAGGTGGNASVQGGTERTQYDSFAFGYAAPGLSVHNNGVYGDETVTTPYGFQVPAIGGGYNGTDVEPTVGFVWRNIDAFQAAYFESLDATPADRDRAEFRRAFVCAYIPKLADQLTKVSPYRCQ